MIEKKEIELKRKPSYEINLNREEEKNENEDILNKSDIMTLEKDLPQHILLKKKKCLPLSKKMQYFCSVLLILTVFLGVNVSLLIISKTRTSSYHLETITPNNTLNSSNITINDSNTNKSVNNTNNNANDDSVDKNKNNETLIENKDNETIYPRKLFFEINQSLFVNEEEKSKYDTHFIEILNLSIFFENEDEFNIKINDQNPLSNRFILPEYYPFPFTKNYTNLSQEFIKPNYLIDIGNNTHFFIRIRRKSTNEIIFDTTQINFLFTHQFIEFGTRLPSSYLFGLGERKAEFLYKPGIYTIWNRNSVSELDNGTPGHQAFGTHPVYLTKEKSGNFHIVLLKNVNGMQFEFNEQNELTFKIIGGGIIDLKFFLGSKKPETALKKYHLFINGFSMMPFWAFGLHQAIIGRFEPHKISKILEKYKENYLPIDSIWSDVELMQKCNKTNEASTFEVIKELEKKVKFINQINFGIPLDAKNEFFQKAMEVDILIKSAKTKKPLIACQCGDKIVLPDFNHPNITKYWFNLLEKYHEKTLFSGISLTLNEPTLSKGFNGELRNIEENCPVFFSEPVENMTNTTIDKLDNIINIFENFTGWIDNSIEKIDMSLLPFVPQQNLEKETLSIDSYHYNASQWFNVSELRELDFHNLNGFFSAYYTSLALNTYLNISDSFLSTKSSIFGTGNFATHWIGESLFSWSFLKTSIASIFNANLFNLPFSGIDVCSFSEYPNSELCARWIQLGSLYPLTRFRISENSLDFGLFTFNESFVIDAAKASLKLRYSLLKYYYSLFERKNGTGSIFKPLFFEFPDEDIVYNIETQFMLGSDIMVTPVLEPKLESISVYFPKNIKWVNFNTREMFFNKQGFKQDIDAKLNESCPIFIREGSIVYFQKAENITNTKNLDNHFKLIAVLKNISKNEYYAQSQIFTINDYNDENKLMSCRKNIDPNHCFITMIIKSTMLGAPEYLTETTIEFLASENSYLEDVYFEEIDLYGIQTRDKSSKKNIFFDQKLKIEKNFKKTFVHS